MESLIEQAIPLLFEYFPIYDEEHRLPLEKLIIGHYLYREIGVTPIARWKWNFNQRLKEIMPMFNQLYASLGLEGDLFANTNYKTEKDGSNTLTMEKGTTDTTTHNTTDTTTLGEKHTTTLDTQTRTDNEFLPGTTNITTENNTPQTQIQSFLDNQYMSSANKSWTTGMDESNSTVKNTGTSTLDDTGTNTTSRTGDDKLTRSGSDTDSNQYHDATKVSGKIGGKSYIELIQEYRNNIFSIDSMIINELEVCFFSVY